VKIAKVYPKGLAKPAEFVQVLKAGCTVQFDSRDGWILTATAPGSKGVKQDFRWFHPADVRFEWVKEFRFGC
jgi:hypothetical protein